MSTPEIKNNSYFAYVSRTNSNNSSGVKSSSLQPGSYRLKTSGKAANWAAVGTGGGYHVFSALNNSSPAIKIELGQQSVSQTSTIDNSYLNDLQKLQMTMSLVNQGTQILGKGIDAFSGLLETSTKPVSDDDTAHYDASTLQSTVNLLQTTNVESAAKFETSMENAKNSKDLGEAINAAINYQKSLPQTIEEKQTAVTELEKFFEDNKDNIANNAKELKKVEGEKKAAEQSLQKAQTVVTKNESDVTQAKSKVAFAKKQLSEVNDAYSTAKTALEEAEVNVSNLEQQLASATTDEQKSSIQSQLDTAKQTLETKRTDEQKAKEACKNADENSKAAEKALADAQKELQDAETSLETAKKNLQKVKNYLTGIENRYNELKNKHTEYETKKQDLADAKADLEMLCKEQKSLSKSIADQRDRLSNMYKAENKEIDKLKKEQNKEDNKADKAAKKGKAEAYQKHENNETALNEKSQTIQENQIKPEELNKLKKPPEELIKAEIKAVKAAGSGYVNGIYVSYDKNSNNFEVHNTGMMGIGFLSRNDMLSENQLISKFTR